MANKDLLKEAIADAKAVKEVAIANAKLALEEAFTPHLKSMLSAKLEEMENEDSNEDNVKENEDRDDREKVDEINLDELLAELDEEISDEDKTEVDREADAIRDDADQISKLAKDAGEDAEDIKDKVEDDKAIDSVRDDMDQISKLAKDAGEDAKDVKITEDERTDAEEEGYLDGMKDEKEDTDDEVDDEIDLEDMSEDDLKGFIEDVIKDMVVDGTIEAGEEYVEDEVEVEDEEEIDVEDEDTVDVDVEIDEARRGRKEPMTKKEKAEGDDRDYDDPAEVETEKMRLKEAIAQVNELKAELNEVNILNAKLLYSNKIFKSKNLTESKKVKVLKAFDKATSVKEAKVIFETLNEGLTTKTSTFNRVKGSASKATGMISEARKPIIESNAVYNRMRQLAGLI